MSKTGRVHAFIQHITVGEAHNTHTHTVWDKVLWDKAKLGTGKRHSEEGMKFLSYVRVQGRPASYGNI